jgi:hypothetical protein
VPTGNDSPYYRGARWADPDADALVELLRRAAKSPDERIAKGKHARAEAERWPWSRGVDAIVERLAAFDG